MLEQHILSCIQKKIEDLQQQMNSGPAPAMNSLNAEHTHTHSHGNGREEHEKIRRTESQENVILDPLAALRQQARRNAARYTRRQITWADVVTGLEEYEQRQSPTRTRPGTAAASLTLPGLDKALVNARRKRVTIRAMDQARAKQGRPQTSHASYHV